MYEDGRSGKVQTQIDGKHRYQREGKGEENNRYTNRRRRWWTVGRQRDRQSTGQHRERKDGEKEREERGGVGINVCVRAQVFIGRSSSRSAPRTLGD